MNKHFKSSPDLYQSSSKGIFLSQKKQTSVLCGLCQMFNRQQMIISKKQSIFENKSSLKCFSKQDSNIIKLSKKSLKASKKFKDFLEKSKSSQPIQDTLQSQKIQKSTNLNSQIVINSSEFKKTQSSEKYSNFCKSPVFPFHNQKKQKPMHYSSSCINLKNYYHKSKKLQNQNNHHAQNYPAVLMTKSVSSQLISINHKMSKDQNFGQKSYENQKLENLKFKSSMSQKFSSLQISPVRPLPIPQQSQRSGGLVSGGRNDQDQTTINKLLDLQSGQNLQKTKEQDVSARTFKANQKLNNLQENMTKPLCQIKLIPIVPQIQKDFSSKSGQNRDYLQISFQKSQQLEKYEPKYHMLYSDELTTIKKNIQEKLIHSNEIEIKVIAQKAPSSDIGSDMNEPQHTQIAQKNDIINQKPNKISSGFGRYSVQIPKSKNFKNMKVRRTISMKDQQDSSQQETSQVIYGFRNINNLVVMEDIAQDMQESYMTKRQFNFDIS